MTKDEYLDELAATVWTVSVVSGEWNLFSVDQSSHFDQSQNTELHTFRRSPDRDPACAPPRTGNATPQTREVGANRVRWSGSWTLGRTEPCHSHVRLSHNDSITWIAVRSVPYFAGAPCGDRDRLRDRSAISSEASGLQSVAELSLTSQASSGRGGVSNLLLEAVDCHAAFAQRRDTVPSVLKRLRQADRALLELTDLGVEPIEFDGNHASVSSLVTLVRLRYFVVDGPESRTCVWGEEVPCIRSHACGLMLHTSGLDARVQGELDAVRFTICQ